MRLIGFSRRKLNKESDLEAVLDIVGSIFGDTDFRFTTDVSSSKKSPTFDFKRGAAILQNQNCLGFWKENTVSIWIDNQACKSRNLIYPHYRVEIDVMDSFRSLRVEDWLMMVEKLVDTMGMELVIVLGEKENAAGYYRTPLNVGIGLIKVNWIMGFGEGYSRLLASKGEKTNFFIRSEFGKMGLKAFVSAPSFEAYQAAPVELLALQKMEIGNDLFNRLPDEERRRLKSGAYWIFDPIVMFHFVAFLFRQYTTNWRKYQAKLAPDYYKRSN